MAQHDLYPAPSGSGYLLDVQSDLLDGLNTRIAVPLLPEAAAPRPARILNPVFEIAGERHVLATQYLAAVPAGLLRQPVGSLAPHGHEVTRALDMLFQGF
ncbi:CcdB family protein [Rhodobacter sp. NSM]|uniref:CcdB family protein n=1 Tax=Rhodobacter sp. NSM TaxID=3457501 RepID=UPI003FD3B45C